MASYAQLIRDLTPPLIWNFGKRRLPFLVRAMGGHFTHIRYEGDYATFAEARAASTGYDAPSILQRTRDAIFKVKMGHNRWERDAMVSDSDEMPWSLLACLMRIAALKGRPELSVLDFGGSLGSTYFWCRPFFSPDFRVRWNVVEQRAHVEVGQREFQDEQLRFSHSVSEALAHGRPDVMILSGVLNFLDKPEEFLSDFVSHGIPYFILDRTPLWDRPRHRLTVQHVPKEIYPASYPSWFFSRERIFSIIGAKYELRWKAPDTEVWEIDGEPVQNSLWCFQLRSSVPTLAEP